MRRPPFILLAAAFLLASCGGSRREEIPPWLRPAEKPRDENYHGGPVAMLLRYDANHDGVLERKELEAGLRAEFAAADTRHTGCLDADQAAAINQKRIDADQSTATPLIDWNHDGCIDYTEFSAAPYSLFDQLDRNGDGKLTAQEMGQKPNARPGDTDHDTGPGGGGQDHRRGPRRGPPGEPGQGPDGPGPGRDEGGGSLPAVPN